MLLTWLNFSGIPKGTSLGNFFSQFWMCFFMVKYSISHILGFVGPIDLKWKRRAFIGCWVNYVTSAFDFTHDLDHGNSRCPIDFNSLSPGIYSFLTSQWVNSVPPYVWKLHFMYEVVRTSSKCRWNIYRTSSKCCWSIYRTSRKCRGTLRVVHKVERSSPTVYMTGHEYCRK